MAITLSDAIQKEVITEFRTNRQIHDEYLVEDNDHDAMRWAERNEGAFDLLELIVGKEAANRLFEQAMEGCDQHAREYAAGFAAGKDGADLVAGQFDYAFKRGYAAGKSRS